MYCVRNQGQDSLSVSSCPFQFAQNPFCAWESQYLGLQLTVLSDRSFRGRLSSTHYLAIETLKKSPAEPASFSPPAVDSETERSSIYRAEAAWHLRSGRLRMAREAAERCSSPKRHYLCRPCALRGWRRPTGQRVVRCRVWTEGESLGQREYVGVLAGPRDQNQIMSSEPAPANPSPIR